MTEFTKITSKMIQRAVEKEVKPPQISLSIGMDMNEVITNWPMKAETTIWLAPTRKDVLLRTKRHRILLGYTYSNGEKDIRTIAHYAIHQQQIAQGSYSGNLTMRNPHGTTLSGHGNQKKVQCN